MLRRLTRDSAIYGSAGLFSRGLQVVMVPLYTRVLSPQEFGVIDLMAMFAAIVNLTVALEISQGVARYYATTECQREKVAYASSAFWFTIGMYGIFAIVCTIFSNSLTRLLLRSTQWEGVFQTAVIAMGCTGVFWLMQDLLRWSFKPKRYVAASLFFSVVSTGVAALLIFCAEAGVAGIFWGQIVGGALGSLVAFGLSKGRYGLLLSWKRCKEMLAFSMPLVPSSISVFFSLYVDRISIRALLDLKEVGLYGVGFRLASVISLLIIGIQGALTPLIYQNHTKTSTPVDLERIFRFFLAGSLPFYVGVSLFSTQIIKWFAAAEYESAWRVVPILGIGILASNLYIFAPGLAIAKRTKVIAGINITAAFLNALGNLCLLPIIRLPGAAISTSLSALFCFAMHMAFSQKYYKVDHQWGRCIGALVISVAAVVIGVENGFLSGSIWGTGIALKIFLVLVSSLAVAFLLFRREEITLALNKIGLGGKPRFT